MDIMDITANPGFAFGAGLSPAPAAEEGTLRHGMMDRALHRERQREMMRSMAQRHEMHRRMMRRGSRPDLDV